MHSISYVSSPLDFSERVEKHIKSGYTHVVNVTKKVKKSYGMTYWCADTLGEDRYKMVWSTEETVLLFKDPEDAILFKLMWG